jgi:crotonobetainyl-CoA:carnitine CoA-transferase CaiB-like acyl-CoA transferase
MPRPFEGIRVIDATHVLAGPFATYQLAVLEEIMLSRSAAEWETFLKANHVPATKPARSSIRLNSAKTQVVRSNFTRHRFVRSSVL